MERKPLVIINGRVRTLPSGDTVPGGAGSSNILTGITCDSDVYVGAAVYLDKGTEVDVTIDLWNSVSGVLRLDATTYGVSAKLAMADIISTSNVIGVVESKASSTECDILYTGMTSNLYIGLDIFKEYFLSDTVAGLIVPEEGKPTASGSYLVKVGSPANPSQMILHRGERKVIL